MRIERIPETISISQKRPSKFVDAAKERLTDEVPIEELTQSFLSERASSIDKLYQQFLEQKAMERECEKNPFLNCFVWETDLPDSIKAVLDASMVLRVKDIVEYDWDDLEQLTSLSKYDIEIIAKYLEKNGIIMGN